MATKPKRTTKIDCRVPQSFRPATGPKYVSLGTGTLYCTGCKVVFRVGTESTHERQNPEQHGRP